MGNVGVENGPRILHSKHEEAMDVAEFAAQGIRARFQKLRSYLADLTFTVNECRPERWRPIASPTHGNIRESDEEHWPPRPRCSRVTAMASMPSRVVKLLSLSSNIST